MPAFKQNSVRFSIFTASMLLGMALFVPLKLLGTEQPAVPAVQTDSSTPQTASPVPLPEPPALETELLDTFDTQRDYLSGKIISFATNIDRFFGDERNYQESNKSVLQLALARASGYGGDHKLVLSARANLNLPSTEKRLHLLVESNPDQNITGEPVQTQNTPLTTQVSTPQSYGMALRYEKIKEELNAMHLSADAGLKFQGININPFVRTRGSYSMAMDQWRLKAYESVFWFNSIGAGETTQLDLEHVLSEPMLFRATSNATWLKDKNNFDLRQDFSIYHTINERTALLYQASVIGISNPQYEVTDYVAMIHYRYRLHRQWMFFELSPQLHFPKENNFQSSFALSMRLEVLFDGSK
jgi:hypothetical protein